MDEGLMWYIAGSALYVMVIHFAMHVKREFSIMIMGAIFVFGGVIGGYLDSYLTGFIFAAAFTLLFW